MISPAFNSKGKELFIKNNEFMNVAVGFNQK